MKKQLFTATACAALVFAASGALAQGMGNMMDRYDTDHDGKVSLTEYENGRAFMFQRLDADGNGSVSFAEIDAAAKQFDRMAARINALKEADTNNDQSISADEFKAASDAQFKKLDTNNDGFLSSDELMAGMGGR
ncbi:MAG: EF-hand domain-containing protein [Asticcacaulis sp.]